MLLRRKREAYQTVLKVVPPRPSSAGRSPAMAVPSTTARQLCRSLSHGPIATTRTQRPPHSPHQYYQQYHQYQSHRQQLEFHQGAGLDHFHRRSHRSCSVTHGSTSPRLYYPTRSLLSGRRSIHNATFDPELAACMDRWIRVAFSGQRRTNSSLAKPLPRSPATAYNVVDVASSGVSDADPAVTQQDSSSILQPDATLSSSPVQIAHREDLLKFRNAMYGTCLGRYELPPQFRPLDPSRNKGRLMVTVAQRMEIEAIWKDYLSLFERTRTDSSVQRLSRADYTRLMRTLRYAHDSTTAAKRILTVEQNRRAQGTNSTREICEISAQAHLILGDVTDAIRLYYEAAEISGLGSPKHMKLLHTMTDAFAINQLVPDGIAFLDQVPKWNSDDEDTLSFVLSLYRELYLYQYSSRSNHTALPSPPPLPPSSHAPIKYLTDKPLPPHTNHALKTLSTLENHADRTELLCVFSKTVAGMLIWAGRLEIVTPLIRSLVESGNIDEAARVLHLVKQRGMELDMERIRQHLLRSYGTCVDKKQLEQSITRWDALTIQQPGTVSSSALPSSSPSSSTNNISQIQQVYSDLVQRCIREGDLNGAMGAAQFMSKHNWRLQGVDPHQLTSLTVNYGQSTDYPAYLDVRYIFGGSLDPDLHTYRRLIYAACRRSDLFTALTLFKQVQARHKHWKLDTSFYNAIISTAAATKQVRLAERTFATMLENGIRPDYFSFHGLLNGYARTGDLEAAILMPQHMVDLKLNPTTRTFNLVMKAYLGSRMDLSTSQKLLKVMQGSGEKAVPPDLVTFNQLLEGYRRVGNTTWFDAYFDRYFGNENSPAAAAAAAASGADHSRDASDLTEPYSSHQRGDDNEDIDYVSDPTYKEQRRGSGSLADNSTIPPKEIRPEKTDDRTLLIQLKHSLLLPSVDLTTVQELWRAIEPRMQPVSSASLPTSPSWDSVGEDQYPEEFSRNPPSSAASDGSQVVPPTYVPFERYLAPVWKPATDQDYFRFSTITLFRSAFQSRGYLGGVKQMDRLLAALFPNHPLGQEVQRKKTIRWIRRVIKNSDGDSSSSSKSQSGDKEKDKSMDKGKSKGKGRKER